MDETGLVNGYQCLGQPSRESQDAGRRERSLSVDGLLQRRARDVTGDQPGLLGVRIGINHGGRERATDKPCRLHFPTETGAESRLADKLRMHHLHRDAPAARGTR
jgi:hypothetical protein